MRLFTLFSYLITKESYDWLITRRKWGFKHQISKEKDLKMSIANIQKHLGGFRRRARWLRNWPLAWCDWLPMALTSSFQLRFANRLKRWIADFPRFELKYSMHQMDFKNCSKSVKRLMSSWILHVRFLSLLSSLHS